MEVPTVEQVVEVKSRGSEDDIYLDLLVRVAALTPVEHSATIADEICFRLRDHFTGLTTIDVNFLPAPEVSPDFAHVAQAEAAALGISVHEIAVAEVDNGLAFDAHVEVDGQQTLDVAHRVVSRFEERLLHAIPELTSVVTHIEPAYGSRPCADCDSEEEHFAHSIMASVQELYPGGYWHELVIRTEPTGGYTVSMHCQVKGGLTVDEVHQTAEQVEAQLRVKFPEIHRLTIHTEPLVGELMKN
jgi:divalent metal cation (Fe/Co/Zn/Cd) transporter